MLRHGIAIGVLTSLALSASSWLLLHSGHPQWGLYGQLSAPVLLIGGLYFGLRAHFDRGIPITVPEAVRVGLGIALAAGFITSGFAWLYYTAINPRYMDALTIIYRQQMTADGFRPADVEAALNRMRAGFSIRTQIITTLSQSLTVAVVASAVMGSLFRRPPRPDDPAAGS